MYMYVQFFFQQCSAPLQNNLIHVLFDTLFFLILFLQNHGSVQNIYIKVGCKGLYIARICEPRHEKTSSLHMRKQKTQISFAVTAKLISAFVFATWKVQYLFFLNTKFQASSHLQ